MVLLPAGQRHRIARAGGASTSIGSRGARAGCDDRRRVRGVGNACRLSRAVRLRHGRCGPGVARVRHVEDRAPQHRAHLDTVGGRRGSRRRWSCSDSRGGQTQLRRLEHHVACRRSNLDRCRAADRAPVDAVVARAERGACRPYPKRRARGDRIAPARLGTADPRAHPEAGGQARGGCPVGPQSGARAAWVALRRRRAARHVVECVDPRGRRRGGRHVWDRGRGDHRR